LRLPESARDKCRDGLFREWAPERRPEKWLIQLPADVVEDTDPKGKVVLDAGTGKGRFAIAFAKAGAEKVVASDISPLMVELARQEAKKAGVLDRITFEVEDIEHLKYPDDTFDIACSMGTSIHTPNPSRGLSELKRVCKPGGFVVFDATITDPISVGPYWKSFSEAEFLKLFEDNGLKVEHKRIYSGTPTSSITCVARKQNFNITPEKG